MMETAAQPGSGGIQIPGVVVDAAFTSLNGAAGAPVSEASAGSTDTANPVGSDPFAAPVAPSLPATPPTPPAPPAPPVQYEEPPVRRVAVPVPAVEQALEQAVPAGAGAAAEPVAPEPAPVEEKKGRTRGGGMAAGGRPVDAPPPPPEFPEWPGPRNADEVYVPEEFDVTDLMEVNRELNRARARLFRVSQQLKLAQRTLAEAQSTYDRAFRREMVSISGGTAESRKAMAEIRCEAYENRIVVGRQVVEEWRKRAVDCRDDLKAIENIAHNVRAQMDIR